MYFATNCPNPALIAPELMRRIRAAPTLSWYALVDGAFDYDADRTPLARFAHNSPTYECDAYDALLAVSPCLLTLETGNDATLREQLTTLVRHRRNRPMLSFIGSESTAVALNVNFQRYASAATRDGDSYMLRFADTRVLPAIAASLQPASWSGMCRAIQAWHYIDRSGMVDQVPLARHDGEAMAAFALSDVEFSALVTAGEPDAVIHALECSNPELLPPDHHADFYAQVASACRFASMHNIDAFPDVVAIVTYTIVAGPAVLSQAAFIELLAQPSWQRGQLIDAIVSLAAEAA